jgi:tRNA nucleotidyltransferase (CCA-adding enzyme)
VVDATAAGQIERYFREWRHVRTILDGNDLLALGLKPGPQIGRLLEQLLVARLDSAVSDEAGERQLLQELIENSE